MTNDAALLKLLEEEMDNEAPKALRDGRSHNLEYVKALKTVYDVVQRRQNDKRNVFNAPVFVEEAGGKEIEPGQVFLMNFDNTPRDKLTSI